MVKIAKTKKPVKTAKKPVKKATPVKKDLDMENIRSYSLPDGRELMVKIYPEERKVDVSVVRPTVDADCKPVKTMSDDGEATRFALGGVSLTRCDGMTMTTTCYTVETLKALTCLIITDPEFFDKFK